MSQDDELHGLLIKVRGIGPWTIDMFAIFSLRRPNILPVGDLGVQRGVLRWFISQHTNPQGEVRLNKEKQVETKEEKLEEESQLPPLDTVKEDSPRGVLQTPKKREGVPQTPKKKGIGSTSETPQKVEPNVVESREEGGEPDRLPVPFTPSISRVLQPTPSEWKPPPLPSGLSVGVMKSRLGGKKKIKLRNMRTILF
jgi:DNA-3-methyladenine glycosylase II